MICVTCVKVASRKKGKGETVNKGLLTDLPKEKKRKDCDFMKTIITVTFLFLL